MAIPFNGSGLGSPALWHVRSTWRFGVPSRYEAPVDPDAANNAHAYMVQMVGWNRRVLELGAASGHVTRALIAQSCRVTAVEYDPEAAPELRKIAQDVVIGDLNIPSTLAALQPEFDVVLAGDVLEHLMDPQSVLNRVTSLLAPGGRVVVSLPHIAHVDVRLSLLQGRFDYSEWGLLDATHIRFFTLKRVMETVKRAGLVMTELKRVRIPAFESELRVDRASVPTAVLDAALADPEAETYQFVFTAVRDDGDFRTEQLANRNLELQAEMDRILIEQHLAQIESDARALSDAEATARADARADDEGSQRAIAEEQLRALRQSRTFRYTSLPRKMYKRIRTSWS
ncbi:MAG: class I SAM-dependent methyltransferase [Candidatus Dormibacteraeota bacterium]|uniref:Class I SAM-dependent methyltransferase n=1 Tax=Candidatus Amunia macphersoniae TaxID=3127014 RepID=A0A934KPG2_9BACT|nr:class I SAM-dependent methyltransferase [Candidatus Dormibacteraeota bacterium]